MKRLLPLAFWFLALCVCVFVIRAAYAERYYTAPNVQRIRTVQTDTLLIEDSNGFGSPMEFVAGGVASFASGDTTDTLSIPGARSGDLLGHTIKTGNSSGRFVKSASVADDAVSLVLSGTPGATTTVDVMVFRLTF